MQLLRSFASAVACRKLDAAGAHVNLESRCARHWSIVTPRRRQSRNGAFTDTDYLIKIADRDFQVSQKPILHPVNPAMHCQFLSAFPGVAGNIGAADVGHLLYNVQLAKSIGSLG